MSLCLFLPFLSVNSGLCVCVFYTVKRATFYLKVHRNMFDGRWGAYSVLPNATAGLKGRDRGNGEVGRKVKEGRKRREHKGKEGRTI